MRIIKILLVLPFYLVDTFITLLFVILPIIICDFLKDGYRDLSRMFVDIGKWIK